MSTVFPCGFAELRSREERSQQYFGTHLGPDSGLLMDSAAGDDVIYDKVRSDVMYDKVSDDVIYDKASGNNIICEKVSNDVVYDKVSDSVIYG